MGATLHRGAGTALHRGARAFHYRGPSRCGAQAPDAQAEHVLLNSNVYFSSCIDSSTSNNRSCYQCVLFFKKKKKKASLLTVKDIDTNELGGAWLHSALWCYLSLGDV